MNASPSLDDIRRARYDRLLFSAERCQTEAHVSTNDSVEWKQRRRMLELGAMGTLEAELEALPSRSSSTREQGVCGRELENLKSCMSHLLNRHYENLGKRRERQMGCSRILLRAGVAVGHLIRATAYY